MAKDASKVTMTPKAAPKPPEVLALPPAVAIGRFVGTAAAMITGVVSLCASLVLRVEAPDAVFRALCLGLAIKFVVGFVATALARSLLEHKPAAPSPAQGGETS